MTSVLIVLRVPSAITREDLEFSVGSKASVWEVKDPLLPVSNLTTCRIPSTRDLTTNWNSLMHSPIPTTSMKIRNLLITAAVVLWSVACQVTIITVAPVTYREATRMLPAAFPVMEVVTSLKLDIPVATKVEVKTLRHRRPAQANHNA